MTPAPISVERLSPAISDYPGNHFEDAEPIMVATLDGEYVRHSDYAALLQQLAELQEQADRFHARAEAYRKDSEAAESKLAERDAELSSLRQACWDARAVLGFDNDGAPTPAALKFPMLTDLVRRDAAEFRKDYDEVCAEVCAEFDKRVEAERARDGMREQLRIESALLLAWARESREGGWSTHQVDPMKRRAGEIDAFLAASGGDRP